jgi:predicted AlkP superfamily pyrophosphatase or phosphodiesterase
MHRSPVFAFVAALALAGSAAAQQPASAPANAAGPRPTLIIAISVDQFSANLFAEYRDRFAGGLKRLAHGVVFPSGYQSHAATETCPGHSTILTGDRPARTGIVANTWYDPGAARKDKFVYCAEDERVPGTSSSSYAVSNMHLRVPALGDYMRRADPRSRAVAVAGKDRAAMMMGGQNPSQAWWWDGKTFTSHAGVAPLAAVDRVNARVREQLSEARAPMELPPICAPVSGAIRLEGGGHDVGNGRFARKAGDRTAFRASPDFDQDILALAEGARDELRLGENGVPDLLAIGLSATDYIGHTYGPGGSEMCIQLLELDRILGAFFDALDRTGIDYVVMLTADHGGIDIPERSRERGVVDAVRVDPALDVEHVGRTVAGRLHIRGPVLIGEGAFGDMYLAPSLPARVREQVLLEAVGIYRAHRQVAAVFTKAELRAAPLPSGPPDAWSLRDRARASFDPQRSGDLVVLLKPRVMPIFDTSHGYVSTHGSPWDYDRRVPILFWRRGLSPFEQPLSVETVDIMPTLAALIGLSLPKGSVDGHCLDVINGPPSSCTVP